MAVPASLVDSKLMSSIGSELIGCDRAIFDVERSAQLL